MPDIDFFTDELLHLDEVRSNRLVSIAGGGTLSDGAKAYTLYYGEDNGSFALKCAKELRGKPSNRTVLDGSAPIAGAPVNPAAIKWQFSDLNGNKNADGLDKFIADAYNEINLKGNNPLFLGVGAVERQVVYSDEVLTVKSPLIIVPVRLVRGTKSGVVELEFPADDAYFNPCLYAGLKRDLPYVAENFPCPAESFDSPVDFATFDGGAYLDRVGKHIAETGAGALNFDKNAVYIAQYNHGDTCMYYDVKRNREKIAKSPLVGRIFGEKYPLPEVKEGRAPRLVLPADSVQEELISSILAGQSLIIKGPPGTGKTLTIANIISSLLAEGKRVLFASKKLSALSEVNAKLPESLRKFVLLLDCETERAAAKVNPAEIKADFKMLLREKREYTPDTNAEKRYAAAVRERTEAVLDLNGYYGDMFAGEPSYYDLLDEYLKSDLPVVDFAEPLAAALLSSENVADLTLRAAEGGKFLDELSCEGFYKCPWLGATETTDTEGAYRAYLMITETARSVADGAKKLCGGGAEKITLGNLTEIFGECDFSEEEVEKFCRADSAKLAHIRGAVGEYFAASGRTDLDFGDCEIESLSLKLSASGADESLKLCEISLISQCGAAFLKDAVDCENINSVFKKAEELLKENKTRLNAVYALAAGAKGNEDKIAECLKPLSKYEEADKLPLFDFRAKKAYKTVAAFSDGKLTVRQAAEVASNAFKAQKCVEDIQALLEILSKLFGKKLNRSEFECLELVCRKCLKSGISAGQYIECAVRVQSVLDGSFKAAQPADMTLGELTAALENKVKYNALVAEIADVCDNAGVETPLRGEKLLKSFKTACAFAQAEERGAGALVKAVKEFKGLGEETEKLAAQLKEFGEKYFENYFTRDIENITVGEAGILVRNAGNRALIRAALGYSAVLADKNPIDLSLFFAPFESGKLKGGYAEIFRRSYIKLMIDFRRTALGNRRNGLGRHAGDALEKFARAEAKIRECNASLIENLCMSRIDAEDSDFAFLDADKGVKTTLRSLFKFHADAILKLKRCLIMSPSSASLLLRPQEYENFDVAIIDEASQSEPVTLLPLLFRAKQCVLVGDEFQMPPLVHFKAKNRAKIDSEECELVPDGDISALSLALGNNAFPTGELTCHYRSNTEALIAFSQREFYPFMRTFPAAYPFTDELGFEDIHTPDGRCENGVNAIEAEEAVKALGRHFDRYYDEEDGKLKKSVGVVAFGESQLGYIQNLVKRNAALSQKIERAKLNFDDVPEKLIFFRTIESVQGQETENLILSLTYGRDKNGALRQSFGELNRDALGANIFNVAVTRAKSKITVIHSVTAEEISGNPRIEFISRYLAISRRFAGGERLKYMTEELKKGGGFVRSVADFIVSEGIAPERVIVNYGVTDGSVRIPVAVLSKDLSHAELGIWCELPVQKKYDFFDYNSRYFSSLVSRGWKMRVIWAHEWTDNAIYERETLKKALNAIK